MADKPSDKEVKTRKAEAKVKDLVQKEGALVKSDNAQKAADKTARTDKVNAAKASVKPTVMAEGALVKSDNALKAASKATQSEGILSKVSRFAGKAGESVRGALRAGRGKAGPLGALALGASLSMEAGHAVDQAIARTRAKTPEVADDKSLGPRRNAEAVRAAAARASAGDTPKKAPAGESPAPAKTVTSTGPKTSKSTDAPAKKGAYPVYRKESSNAQSFRTAFAAAKKAGKDGFTWEGRKYNTKTK